MDFGIALLTVIVCAIVLAVGAGFMAARVLMHASEARPSQGGRTHDR